MRNIFGAYILILFLSSGSAFAQTKYSISGNIKDAANGEDLIGATVRVVELSGVGATSNVYGFYSLTLPEGNYTLEYSFVGYITIKKEITLTQNLKINMELNSNTEVLDELVITADKEDQNVTKNEMSVTKITTKEIESIPVIFGEKDIIKVMQLTPGVKSAGEGNSGFFVRGGAADQNLILLDEAPVYNASHLLGFFSVFNSDVIKDATLYKGGMPAKYGGRASSVMDIKTIDGNSKELAVKGGIGLISSKLTVEAPIVKNKGSFVVSGRRTYADLFLKLSNNAALRNNQLYFYDFTAKANYQVSEKDRVYVSGYFGRDNLGFGNTFSFDWGNITGSLRWNHIFSDKLFSNTSIIFSDYNYKINQSVGTQSLVISSLIRDWNFKQDFGYYLNDKNTLEFGANVIYHKFLPGSLTEGEVSTLKLDDKNALESAIYVQNNSQINGVFSINYGIRYSHFNLVGPGTKYVFDSQGNTVSADKYSAGQSIQQYGGIEPRINLKYQLNDVSSIKSSYNRNYQYMHLLSNSTSAQPNDIWVPSSNNIKPLIADQFALGYFRNFKHNMYTFSLEGYYKNFQNQLDYMDGANLFLNETVENQLVFGKGYAYGLEFLLKKTKGKFTGWLGYTYSRSFKKIPEINGGSAYPAKQDRIHDISIVAMYRINEKLRLAANWVYYTGNAVTFPSGKYIVNNQYVPYYTERNGYRMPDYHRMDIGLTIDGDKYKSHKDPKTGETIKVAKKVQSSWNFSIYNVYGRQNAYTITFRQNENNPLQSEAVQTALFSIVPSVTYNFKF
ncbi:TonB-dependent receptor [bacterium SCSIO 12643]|nr:TonB-dependent receptor [bacterium SCSIO 12643]